MDQAIKSRDQLHEELSNEKARSDELLLNILPSKVANELKETDKVEPRFYNSVSIMFGDFCGFTKLAEQMPLPSNGEVSRILDMGCGIGQLAVGFKERFPNAEVWGIDAGAPMIRYGHMRAVEMDMEIHFAQRLAETTGFPDNHFDIVGSYILHHEVPAEISKQIAKEVKRILRPGGVFMPVDFYTGTARGREGAYALYSQWKDHRWNEEVWREEYRNLDFPEALRAAGLEVITKGPPAWRSRHNLMAVKPV